MAEREQIEEHEQHKFAHENVDRSWLEKSKRVIVDGFVNREEGGGKDGICNCY